MKPAEHNIKAFRPPASTVELGGSQNDSHHGVSAVPVSSGQTQPSCAGAEVPQAPMSAMPTHDEALSLIAVKYLLATQPNSESDFDKFLAYMKEMRVTITGVSIGSLLITLKCDSLQILERLWENYMSGRLGEVVQRCFVTEEILTDLSLAELELKTTISEEEYKACKKYLLKDPAIEADEIDDGDDLASNAEEADDGNVSVSDDEDQCGNVTIPVEQPIHVHFADEENVRDKDDNLQTETVEEKLKTGTDEGSSGAKDEDQCGNVTIPLEQPIHVPFADEENVRDKDDNFQTETVEEKLKTGTDEGSSVSKDEDQFTSEAVTEVLENTTRFTGRSFLIEWDDMFVDSSDSGPSRSTGEVQRFRSWENPLYQSVKTGLEMFDVSKPVELQDYLTYFTDKMDSAVQESTREQLREFVTIHVKEGAWQVVMLFLDELLHRDSKEDVVSGDLKSRKLAWWPTYEDHDLKVLCKVLTVEDCKVDSLTLRSRKITEEGVKHIAEALCSSHCRLESLHLVCSHVTDEGVTHIAEALSSSHCHLESLDLSWNRIIYEGVKHLAEALCSSHCLLESLHLGCNGVTDKGVKHIAEALSSSHCRLESLDLGWNKVTDEGIKLIAEALSSSHCRLKSLDLSRIKVTDEGVKHLAEALSSSHCHLESLNLGGNEVTDEGVKYIAEALSSSHCRLESLDLGGNKVTDERVKHIAEALSSSQCRLERLVLRVNDVTDEGVKHIAEALSSGQCHLNSLDLMENKVTNKGVKDIAEALSNTYCRLNFLNLSRNYDITDKGVRLLADVLLHSNYELKAKGSSIFVTAKVKSRM